MTTKEDEKEKSVIGGVRRISLLTERIEDFRYPIPSEIKDALAPSARAALLQPQPTSVIEMDFCPLTRPGGRFK